jgi:hypothetical protein
MNERQREAVDMMRRDLVGFVDTNRIFDVSVSLFYPECPDRPKALVLGLVDVRCAEDIRISYDYDRNGWKIEREASRTVNEWKEVAFVSGEVEDAK